MPKKLTRSKIVKKLDAVFSQYIRLSNADKNGYCTCVTCGKKYHWKQIQAGHFMSRKHYSTRWLEDNVKPQCYGCNVMQQGQQYKFSKYLGNNLSEELYNKSKEVVKFTTDELQDKITYYSEQVKKFL
jgi:hypothetical protein|tara:strand:+ start:836 stop:1219 length:384 start_codon:yes stop_codon:yes gene_type:complete